MKHQKRVGERARGLSRKKELDAHEQQPVLLSRLKQQKRSTKPHEISRTVFFVVFREAWRIGFSVKERQRV
jgi:hypothetical protein